MKIYFVRHGETEWNLKKIFQGIKNSPLTKLGKEQARKLKIKLNSIDFTHYYSSPLGRAVETLEILTEDRKEKKLETIEYFREIDMGEMEGVPRDEFEKTYPTQFYNLWYNGKEYDPSEYKGESFQKVLERVRNGLNYLENNHKENDKILIVSHGIALEAIFACINNQGVETFSERQVPKNTSLTIVEYKNNKFKILDFSNTSHLDEEN
ncbi:histidine phosphatase family protein [Fusobacterium perfoetens]|uniref:histidine phosphatase family protein n=1 Tax=Fusobacterium perfoetens TaxID=852 RepID=UPI000481324D|nr:histidine phosphatase family protein [Fusobacterium perfoetens]MCI6151826.1 histidine phosphatase family protein [Fusobacterium perfoetens]MDY3236813.1 histidine phosphatase family protein [Fusobacterium perfoetens]